MRLPIGYDVFSKIIEKQLDFVDKTLFIKDLIDDNTIEVIVFTRPRRFGKTLNLSMLHHFFAANTFGCETKGLFDGLKIAALGEKYMQHQGKYPVILISLKDIKNQKFSDAYEFLTHLFYQVYREHDYLADSTQLTTNDKAAFNAILEQKAPLKRVRSALYDLSYYLHKHHHAKVWLLIDEYDTPIHSAYLHGYYHEMIDLMRGILGTALKNNPYLEKSVITGILRIAKESLFSGLNNVKVCTLFNHQYSEYFGFTETEMSELLKQAHLENQADDIRHWYNGYLVGKTVLYNPWSIANCLNENGELSPYWINTSSNDLVKELLAKGDEKLKENLERLIANQPIQAIVDEYLVFGNLEKDNYAFWSLLLFSGYLKAITSEPDEERWRCTLMPPNYEVRLLYRSIVRGWFTYTLGEKYENFLIHLMQGNVEKFRLGLQNILQETFSIFDVTGHHPEKFYHGFVLGLMVSLEKTHEVQSNKESGDGRYDVMLIPKDRSQLGIVIEFKTVRDANIPLNEAAEEALQQIIDKNYAQHLRQCGIEKILHLGLAFHHKTVAVVSR